MPNRCLPIGQKFLPQRTLRLCGKDLKYILIGVYLRKSAVKFLKSSQSDTRGMGPSIFFLRCAAGESSTLNVLQEIQDGLIQLVRDLGGKEVASLEDHHLGPLYKSVSFLSHF